MKQCVLLLIVALLVLSLAPSAQGELARIAIVLCKSQGSAISVEAFGIPLKE